MYTYYYTTVHKGRHPRMERAAVAAAADRATVHRGRNPRVEGTAVAAAGD